MCDGPIGVGIPQRKELISPSGNANHSPYLGWWETLFLERVFVPWVGKWPKAVGNEQRKMKFGARNGKKSQICWKCGRGIDWGMKLGFGERPFGFLGSKALDVGKHWVQKDEPLFIWGGAICWVWGEWRVFGEPSMEFRIIHSFGGTKRWVLGN